MTENELHSFETQLQTMQTSLEANIARLREELEGVSTAEGIDDMEDFASAESESMHHNALLQQQEHELSEVRHALAKIRDGRYGICEESGDTIPLERLRAEPHARYCVKDAHKRGM